MAHGSDLAGANPAVEPCNFDGMPAAGFGGPGYKHCDQDGRGVLGAVERAIQEGWLRSYLVAGGRVRRVLVAVGGDERGRRTYTPYLSLAGITGYLPLALYRDRGRREWRDFDKLLSWLQADVRSDGPGGGCGYAGVVVVGDRSTSLVRRLDISDPPWVRPQAADDEEPAAETDSPKP